MDRGGRGVNRRKTLLIALAAAALSFMMWSPNARADEGTIRVRSFSVTSEFPEGIRFRLEATSESEITSVAVRFRTGTQARGSYDYLAFERGQTASSELFWRTDAGGRYIPPGTMIRYNFEIEDASGARLDTKVEEFVYYDARFEWTEVEDGPISVAYHGPVRVRAEIILDAIVETLGHMGPLLGADTKLPIRVTMYNNVKEMLEALPPGSATIRRELITEGQAFSQVGTLLVLGSGRLARGTASHEVTHILTHRAGDSIFRRVPAWLDEGLSEYGNVAPGFSYDIALEFAVETDRLLPITFSRVLPGTSEEAIIFYGQARSVVQFMVGWFGPAKMNELMAALRSGRNIDNALELVYGLDRLGLENSWREALGAEPYSPAEEGTARPTPVAWPSVLPYSLTPQPESATIGSLTSTATLEPTATPPATPLPEPTPTPAAVAKGSSPETGQEKSKAAETEENGGGGACSRPEHAGRTPVNLSSIALLVGVVGLAVRRRIRPR